MTMISRRIFGKDFDDQVFICTFSYGFLLLNMLFHENNNLKLIFQIKNPHKINYGLTFLMMSNNTLKNDLCDSRYPTSTILA
jgi:hypothetical protein